MLNAKREVLIDRPTGDVWDFVADMHNWAAQMPGYVSHEQIDGNDSVWSLNVNLGPFNRPIVVEVHVLQWTPPSAVTFELKGRFDPFHGNGSFHATATEQGSLLLLELECEATGKMAKVLNALAIPVLKRVADQFSANLSAAIQAIPQAAPGVASIVHGSPVS